MVTTARFLLLSDVAEILNVSLTQVRALVRSSDLPAIKIGGRGQWRVERIKLEQYIQRLYEDTRLYLANGSDDVLPDDDQDDPGLGRSA